MSETETVDLLRRLIVGSRGRERAERLVCYDADNQQQTIEIKPKTRAVRYADLVASVRPVRIEAYAGKTLVDAWGERPTASTANAPDEPRGERPTSKLKTLVKVPPKVRGVAALASHLASILSGAYSAHAVQLSAAHRTNAERDGKIFDHVVAIAQHHSDRAGHAEARASEAERAVRLRDKQILELHQHLMRMQVQTKIAEVAAESSGGDKTAAFLKLLDLAQANGAAAQQPAKTNGKPKPTKEAAS